MSDTTPHRRAIPFGWFAAFCALPVPVMLTVVPYLRTAAARQCVAWMMVVLGVLGVVLAVLAIRQEGRRRRDALAVLAAQHEAYRRQGGGQ